MTPRTSATHPLQIDRVDTPAGGAIGLTFCPGKKDGAAMTGAWNRDLRTDLEAIRSWPASTLVTLIEDHEFDLLGVPDLGTMASKVGLEWLHLPIRDVSVPDSRFESAWIESGPVLISRLQRGENLVIHCRGGLGRTGLVACQLLVEMGCESEAALKAVRVARPGTVETRMQEQYVRELRAVGTMVSPG